jgi:hypothetical protein
MPTIRRLYLYAVSLISLEVVLWGSIGLLRSLFAADEIGLGGIERLAGALSLILVGIPVFLLHWWWIRRSLLVDPDERSARLRALFLYAVLLITLVPVVQNALAMVDRLLLQLLDLNPTFAFIGGNQAFSDNLVAIVANLVVAFYFYRLLAQDWQFGPVGDAYPETRRLYRYIWLVYGLLLAGIGLQQLINYLLTTWSDLGQRTQAHMADGLALLLAGLPIWIFTSRLIQRSLNQADERDSLLRLVVLYILVFTGVVGALLAGGLLLYELLVVLLGASINIPGFMGQIAQPLSTAVPFALIWAYYARSLRESLHGRDRPTGHEQTVEEQESDKDRQRRSGLRQLYYYVLAFLGLLATFIGLERLLSAILDLAFSVELLGIFALRDQLAAGLAAILVGLPVWILHWRVMLKDASQDGEAGDYARRSLIRKSYIYIVLFAGVLGVMVSAGALIYQALRALLGDPPENLMALEIQNLKTLVLFSTLLAYHWWVLRGDGKLAERWLARRYAQFPVLVLGMEQDNFSPVMVDILHKMIPDLPVALHDLSLGVPDPSLSAARAVIFPAELASNPGEALRLWLQNFTGTRLLVTLPVQGWFWIPGGSRSHESTARQAARLVRQLAEGEEVSQARNASFWMPLVYVFAALFLFELIFGLSMLLVSFIFQ